MRRKRPKPAVHSLDQITLHRADSGRSFQVQQSHGCERRFAVMACDDEVLPSQTRIETVSDDSDLEEVYNTERHLLYVACTRARDFLWVSGADPASEFLDDLTGPKLNV